MLQSDASDLCQWLTNFLTTCFIVLPLLILDVRAPITQPALNPLKVLDQRLQVLDMVDNDVDVFTEVEYFEDFEPLEYSLEIGHKDACEVCGGMLFDVKIDRLRGNGSVHRRIDR